MHARMESTGWINGLLISLTSFSAAAATNDFQNLGFESASFIPVAGGVEASAALPGWKVYVDTNQIGWVLHNNLFLDSAGLAVMGSEPGPQNYYRIEGNYTIVLEGGSESIYPGLGFGFVEAAITQTGLVPAAARSLRFKIGNWNTAFSVYLGGQNVPVVPLSVGTNYLLYAGDIAPFAGHTAELRFTTPSGKHVSLDSIEFSSEPAPLPPPQFSLIGAQVLNGLFGFTIPSVPGTAYRVDVSSNLVDWAVFLTVTNAASIQRIGEYRYASNYNARFYRAVMLNP